MKWIFRVVGLLVVLVAVLAVSLLFLPAERIARIATDQVQAATGRTVSIKGGVELSYWPVLGARVEGLEIGNADWAGDAPMFEAAEVEIGVDARALLSGDIRIKQIEAQSPVIRLEERADGRANWIFETASAPAGAEPAAAPASGSTPEAAPATAISIEKLTIQDASFTYASEGQAPVSYAGVDLSLDWPDGRGAAEIAAEFQPAASAVSLSATIDALDGFLAGEVHSLSARLTTVAGQVSFDGRASTAGAVAGAVALQTPDTDGFLRALGLAGVDLPATLGRRLDVQTNLTLTPDRSLSLRDLVADLGGNRITGAADIALEEVPRINAQLDVGAFDLSSLTGAPAASNTAPAASPAPATPGPAASGWPKDTIDASALAAFNGDIALSARSINLGGFSLGSTRTVLRNDNSRMVFELQEVQAYGGALTGEVVLNNRGGLSVGGRLVASAIEMQPLLRDAVDLNRLTGKGDARLSFLGSGSSVDAIMKSLSGDGGLTIGQGTIQGINLDSLMRSGDLGEGTTIFDALSATWTIAGGVLSNRDLLLELKNYRASGEGNVGLGAQTIDYRFTPVALRANSGQGLAIPVILKGPWSDVSIRPDLEAVYKAKLDEEKEALEQKAKDKLNEKINKELGIAPSDGQSTEDAIKDKLLRKLFE